MAEQQHHPVIHRVGDTLLNGVPVHAVDPPPFTFTVRDSDRVRNAARVGTAATIVATARGEHISFEGFNEAIFNDYSRIGANAVSEFTTLQYTLNYHVTLEKPTREGHHTLINTTFLIYPTYNGRIVTAASDDFNNPSMHIEQTDSEFHNFANKHGSGITLKQVKALEIQFIKAPSPRARRAGSYFKVPFIQRCCINVTNTDDRCFMYAIVAASVRHIVPDPPIIGEGATCLVDPAVYEAYLGMYQWGEQSQHNVDYKLGAKEFEELNPDAPALHVWMRVPHGRYSDTFPIYVSRKMRTATQHIDLYFAEESFKDPKTGNYTKTGKAHYVCVTNMDEFALSYEERSRGVGNHLCRECLKIFDTERELQQHHLQPCHQASGPDVKMPTRVTKVSSECRFGGLTVTLFGVAHAECVLVGKELVISKIGYLLKCHPFYHPPIELQKEFCCGERHNPCTQGCAAQSFLHHLLHLEKHWSQWIKGVDSTCSKEFHIMVTQQTTLSQLIRALQGFTFGNDADGKELLQFSYLAPNTSTPSHFSIGKMRFVDGSNFVSSTPSTVDELPDYEREWAKFREMCVREYQVEPANFWSIGKFAWSAAMRVSKSGADIIQDQQVYDFLNSAKRGAINVIPCRYAEAGDGLYLAHYDIRSSYGYSMMQPLPYSDFKFVDEKDFTPAHILKIDDDAEVGYYLKVDLSCPTDHDWHNKYADLPFAPHHKQVRPGRGMVVCTHEKKRGYVVHYRLLKYYLSKDVVLDRVQKVLSFVQKRWLRPFAQLQQRLRQQYPEFASTIKLITNSAYGYSCAHSQKTDDRVYNVSTKQDMDLFNQFGIGEKTIMLREVAPNIIKTSAHHTSTTVWSPIYVGITILELGKLQLYEAFYDTLHPRCKQLRLLYADTDSLIVTMRNDPLQLINDHEELFLDEFGKLKDEADGHRGTLFVGSKPKHYLYQTEGSSNARIPGLPKDVSRQLTASTFIDVLQGGAEPTAIVTQTHTKDFKVTRQQTIKRYLNAWDDSRVYLEPGGIKSFPYGHISL